MLRRLITIAAIGLLSACAATQTVDMTTPSKTAFAAKSAYAAALVVAAQYTGLPRCGQPKSPPVCSDQAVVNVIRKADLAADSATQAAEDAVRSLGANPNVVTALVTAANQSVVAFASISNTYARK